LLAKLFPSPQAGFSTEGNEETKFLFGWVRRLCFRRSLLLVYWRLGGRGRLPCLRKLSESQPQMFSGSGRGQPTSRRCGTRGSPRDTRS